MSFPSYKDSLGQILNLIYEANKMNEDLVREACAEADVSMGNYIPIVFHEPEIELLYRAARRAHVLFEHLDSIAYKNIPVDNRLTAPITPKTAFEEIFRGAVFAWGEVYVKVLQQIDGKAPKKGYLQSRTASNYISVVSTVEASDRTNWELDLRDLFDWKQRSWQIFTDITPVDDEQSS